MSCGLSRTSERGPSSGHGQNGLASPGRLSAVGLGGAQQRAHLVMRTSWLMRAAAAGRLVEVEKGERRAERSWAGIAARARAQRRGRAMVGGFNGWREGGSQLVQCSLNECRRGLEIGRAHV